MANHGKTPVQLLKMPGLKKVETEQPFSLQSLNSLKFLKFSNVLNPIDRFKNFPMLDREVEPEPPAGVTEILSEHGLV
jgi:hypothetical protein